jgi:hypothetical protein
VIVIFLKQFIFLILCLEFAFVSRFLIMHSRYKQVTQDEKKEDAEEILKKQRTERMDRITSKVHAVFWVVLAVVVAVYTDIFNRAVNDKHVGR